MIDIVLVTTCILLVVFLGINANLLPTWMFVNSFQLIMHTALLSTSMPPNLNYFLYHFLSLLRLNPESLDISMEILMSESGQVDYELSNNEKSYYKALHNMCGYKHALARNLLIIAGIFFALILVIFILNIIDLITQRSSKRRCSSYMCNVLTRFSYEFFLETCLSVFIHITSLQVLEDGLQEVSMMSLVAAFLFLAGIIVFVCFVISRFWFSGPYIEQTYETGSLRRSFWG